MKCIFFFIILILAIQTALAITIELNKETYRPGETLLANFEGNFIDAIKAEDVYLYAGRRIPVVYDLIKVEDKYYVYMLLPEKQENYTLLIKNVHYMQGNTEVTEDLEKNLTLSGDLIDFSVNPGFILAQKDFRIKIINNFGRISLSTEFNSIQDSVEVKAGVTKELSFSIAGFNNFTITELKLSSSNVSYSIPVIVMPETKNFTQIIIEANKLRFSSTSLAVLTFINTRETRTLTLANYGQENLSVSLSYPKMFEDILTFNPESFDLGVGESRDINITIFSSQPGEWKGDLAASSDNLTAQAYVEVAVTENLSGINGSLPPSYTCTELGGSFCGLQEVCSINTTRASDGYSCCTGTCASPSYDGGGSSAVKIIVIIIIVILLVGILFFVYKKYRKRSKTPREILREQESKFKEKFEPTEVTGKLSKT